MSRTPAAPGTATTQPDTSRFNVFLGHRHSPVGTPSRNPIHATSRLMVPVLPPRH